MSKPKASVPADQLQGRWVYSRDGKFLGKITEVEDDWFKVDIRISPDYWLPLDSVREIVYGQVLLEIDEETTLRDRRTR